MADPSIDLWAIDEVHFQQHGTACRMWVPPETVDPVLLHAPTRKGVGYFGAVRLRDGLLIAVREPERFNAVTCHQFLRTVWRVAAPSRRRVVVIADNVSYHHARLHVTWCADRAPRFRLDFLPPYSPELNPIERVWKLTRRLACHNRYFPTLDALITRVEHQFATWRHGSDALRRLCAIT